MADDSRILELVEQALESNLTPEEVCAQCPELVADVRACLNECRDLDSTIERLFPSTPAPRLRGPGLTQGASLPEIPGYEVLGVLGRGGNGVIYRARHLRLNRVVALKMLLSGEFASRAELTRFRREAEAVAALQHPNIVQIYDVGDVDGRPYFTMEFVAGGTLAQKLSGVPQPARYCASLTQTLALAMHEAHLAGIVHRDLKPGNILLTSDGAPKISDFGLARNFEGPTDVTLGAAKIGTPSYMAPEQVIGKPDSVGPPADIYALGATLYELMTGRPPFRGETATETQRQVVNEEPAAPSRLNAKLPRDLETICLKCLQKDPKRRYASAAALSGDLGRFHKGEPIEARRVGRVERTLKWVKRRPAAASALASAALLAMVLAAGGTWFFTQRSATRKTVQADLREVGELQLKSRWQEADAALERAKTHLGERGPQDLVRRFEAARRDSEVVTHLDQIRMKGSVIRFKLVDSEYLDALRGAKIGGPDEDPEVVAARIRASNIKYALITALDDWLCESYKYQPWVLEVLRRADHDPTGWRDHMRSAAVWQNPKALAEGALAAPYANQPVPFLLSMANQLTSMGMTTEFTIALLKRAQEAHPDDFWINLTLADELGKRQNLTEELQYLRAAQAIRPTAAVVPVYLGNVLYSLGKQEESIRAYREALRLEPDSVVTLGNLGFCLSQIHRDAEAIPILQEVVRRGAINPKDTYLLLGQSLLRVGREEEAVSAFRNALSYVASDPKESALAHLSFGSALWDKGRKDEAVEHYREAIRLEPKLATVHHFLGLALLDKGRLDEAIDHLQQAIDIDPTLNLAPTLASTLLQAARADVTAAAAQGSKAAQLSESQQTDKRRQALARLRAILELRSKRLNEHKAVEWSVAAWQTDPALASVREPAAMGKLPDAERADWQRLWSDVAAVVASDPVEQREENAAHRKWVQAAEGYAQALKRAPTDAGHFWYEYAALSELSGDHSSYKNACAHMIDAFGKNGGPRAYHVARACTLAPDAVADISVPAHLAEKELQGNAAQFWSLTEQGALLYRAGHFEEAVPLFEKSLQANDSPGAAVVNWLWLALANQRLGKTDDARRWLEKAQTWLDQFLDGLPPRADQDLGLHLHNWLEANVLRREAEGMISPPASMVPAH